MPFGAVGRRGIVTDEPIVYLLDDEPEVLKALTRLLRAHGFQVRGFVSAREFLATEHPEGVACLVLDVAMPEIDGLQVQEQLRESGVDLPLVFLTAHGDMRTRVRAMKGGADDFLTKPVNAAELLQAIRGVLERAAQQRAAKE